MISRWFKKHFIPHAGNDHRPHFLHGPNARKIVLVLFVIELLVFILPTVFFMHGSNFLALVLPSVLNDLTNEKRVALNLGTLTPSVTLEQAAIMKAQDMATKGYFAHNSPEGLTPWYWLGLAGYKYAMAGENLAVNFTDSRDVTEAWMNSPTHRDNILKQGFTEIGTAAANGFYNGREATFVVQYYARPTTPVTTVATVSTPGSSLAPSEVSPSRETAVLGEEVDTTPVVSEVETQSPAPVSETEEPGPVETVNSFVEKTISSPKYATNIALLTILVLVLFALGINIWPQVGRKHPDLVTNGLALVVLIFGIYLSNNYLLDREPVITLDSVETSFTTFQ